MGVRWCSTGSAPVMNSTRSPDRKLSTAAEASLPKVVRSVIPPQMLSLRMSGSDFDSGWDLSLIKLHMHISESENMKVIV